MSVSWKKRIDLVTRIYMCFLPLNLLVDLHVLFSTTFTRTLDCFFVLFTHRSHPYLVHPFSSFSSPSGSLRTFRAECSLHLLSFSISFLFTVILHVSSFCERCSFCHSVLTFHAKYRIELLEGKRMKGRMKGREWRTKEGHSLCM